MPMTRPLTGLLPTPQSQVYPNARFYGQPPQQQQQHAQHPQHPQSPTTNHRGLLPTPHNPTPERFDRPPPQQMPSYRPALQLYNQSAANNSMQVTPHPTPQPVPPPMTNQSIRLPVPAPVPPPPQRQTNAIQPMMNNVKMESDIQNSQKLEESRIRAVIAEGMESRVQNDLKGFYCLFCEVFCINVIAAERHVESPKHQRVLLP